MTASTRCPLRALRAPLLRTAAPLLSRAEFERGFVQVERTYTGPQTGSEDIVEHMKTCNPRGPLVIQVAKLFPKSDVSSFGESASCLLHHYTSPACSKRLQREALHADRAGKAPLPRDCLCSGMTD